MRLTNFDFSNYKHVSKREKPHGESQSPDKAAYPRRPYRIRYYYRGISKETSNFKSVGFGLTSTEKRQKMGNSILPKLVESANLPPDKIQGYVSVRAVESVFGVTQEFPATTNAHHAKKRDSEDVRRHLERSGLSIIAESPLGMAVVGQAAAYEEISGGRLVARERLTRIAPGIHRYVTRMDLVGDNQPQALGIGYASSKALKIDGIVLEKPRYAHGSLHKADPSPSPARSQKFHLSVPVDVATGLNAVPLHQQGIQGDNVFVVMVDTGHYKHPFFLAQGYNLKPTLSAVPGADCEQDPGAHGTGQSANIFAVAPGVTFQCIRASDDIGFLVATFGGFVKAKNLHPQIITCSWGSNYGDYPPAPPWDSVDEADKALCLEIAHAVEEGIVVIFSAGNGEFGPEPQAPGVISAGGVYMGPTGSLVASDKASGYDSPWFGGVRVPTVSGLVGLSPRAQYIMLPVPPGSLIDVLESRDKPQEVGDGTQPDDGWAMFSGTSAAAPQLAGVAALMIGAKSNLTRSQIKEAMVNTATDVISGTCHQRMGNPAMLGPDLATGAGLVNAKAAFDYIQQMF